MKFYIHNYFELLSLLVAICYINKLKSSYFILFIPFLALTISAELIANDLTLPVKYNNWLYAVMGMITYSFYSYIYFRLTKSKNLRRVIYALGLIFIGYCATFIFQFQSKSITYIMLYSCVGLIICSCMYFYYTLKADDNLADTTYRSGIWVASGILIFYSGLIICLAMISYIVKYDLRVFGQKLHWVIPRVLSVILYSCLSISFILWKKQTKTS